MHAWWVLGWLHGWFNSQLVNLIGVRATVTQLAGWLVGWWGAWLVGGWVNELEGWVDVPGHRGAADSGLDKSRQIGQLDDLWNC